MSIRIAFVDDHPILLDGLVGLYAARPDLDVVAKGHTAVDAVTIADSYKPDVLVIDLSMPGDSLAAIDIIASTQHQTRIVVFTATTTISTAIRALNAGVAGYVLKGSTSDELYTAIKAAHAGETFITPGFATKVIMSMKTEEMRNRAKRQQRLNHREEQIIHGVMKGKTNREIAVSLDISEKTVKHYMTALMSKLSVRNRVELVLVAREQNMVPGEGSQPGA